jgi:PIN domain nuclease of toxin-antitoxin system
MTDRYVLDACALLAMMNDEEGAPTVGNLWRDAHLAGEKILLHAINLMEVHYTLLKNKKESQANQLLSTARNADEPLKLIDYIDLEILTTASSLKAKFRISLADAIAISTALKHKALLVTADHKEMDVVEQSGIRCFHWFR